MTNKTQEHHSTCKSIGEDGKITDSAHTQKKSGGGKGYPSLLRFFSLPLIIFLKKPSLSNYDSTRLFCFFKKIVFYFRRLMRASFPPMINKVIAETSYFKAEDFSLAVETEEDTDVLTIVYLPNSTIKLIARIPRKRIRGAPDFGRAIDILVSPGDLVEIELLSYNSNSTIDLLNTIRAWLSRVQEDLLAIPANRQLEEQRKQLETFISQFENLSDEYPSREEVEKLKNRLTDFETQLADFIKSTVINQEEQNKQLEELSSEMNLLKSKLDSHTKKGFAIVLLNRLREWSKNPTFQQVLAKGAEEATKALISGVEKHIF